MDISKKDVRTLYKKFEWKEEEIQSFVNLDKQNKKIVQIKYISILMFIVIFLAYGINRSGNSVIAKEVVREWDFSDLFTITLGILAYGLVHLSSIILHWLVFRGVKGKAKIIQDEESLIVARIPSHSGWDYAKQFVSCLLIPDYFWAGEFKNKFDSLLCGKSPFRPLSNIETLRFLKKYYIERSNWFNLIGTLVFIILIFIFIDWIVTVDIHLLQFLILIVSMRIISRSLEIMVAFYNDVMVQREKIFIKLDNAINPYKTTEIIEDNVERRIYINSWKNSQLLGFSRASLALHSLVEIVVIFSTVYLLLSIYLGGYFPTGEPEDELGIVKYFLFSFTSSVSFPTLDVNYRWAIPQALQLLTSVVLIIMSFAYYLGKDSTLLPHERELYILKNKLKHKNQQ